MIRAYKRKLKLTKSQETRLRAWMNTCRAVYNLALEVRISAYQINKSYVDKNELTKQLTDLRKGFKWVADVPVGTLQDEIFKLDLAYVNFFKSSKNGFPKFASKKKSRSIALRHSVRIEKDKIVIPKVGKIKLYKDTEVTGLVKVIRIKIEPTGFFAYVCCEVENKKSNSENQTIGLDMGISQFCADSNGGFIENPKHFKVYERRLRIENRSLARKVKFSNSWYKQAKKLNLLHHKIANVRRDFLHKESTKIATANSVVYMEDLNVAGMSKNKNLSKHILDAGWATFRAMLAYKTNVIAINPAYTSQKCCECGEIDKLSRISQSEYCCTSCGYIDNADHNAAKNIKSQGMALNRQREALACA